MRESIGRPSNRRVAPVALLAWALILVAGLCVPGVARASGQGAEVAKEYFTKVNAFLSDARWKNGASWGARGPKLSAWGSSGCFAYAADFTCYMYGVDNPEGGTRFSGVAQVRTGDVIRVSGLGSSGHSVVVLERDGSKLWTAEGNYYTSAGKRVRVADPGYVISGNRIYQVWPGGSRHAMTFLYGHHFTNVGSHTRKTVSSIKLLSAATVSKIAKQVYTGSAIEPSPTITCGGATLVRNVDYTLAYKNNVDAGVATVTVTGTGSWVGTRKVKFRIAPRSISEAGVDKVASKLYTGKAIKPSPKVTYADKVLVKGCDYKLSYRKNKDAGTATIVVRGMGNYTGTKRVKFTILEASVRYRVLRRASGWKRWSSDGASAGGTNAQKRLEAVKVELRCNKYAGSVRYRCRRQGAGWDKTWRSDGAAAGASGKGVGTVQIKLAGAVAKKYDVYYRVYSPTLGWLGWAKNGKKAGVSDNVRVVTSLQVKLVRKGMAAPGSTALPYAVA